MQTRIKIYSIIISLLLTSLITLSSCKKFIEVTVPNTSINGINIYKSDATAAAVLTGIYAKMSNENFSNGISAISLYPALGADELTLFDVTNGQYSSYYRNTLTKDNAATFWNALYSYIFTTNSAIEGLSENASFLTSSVQKQLLGEAKFLRAFFYFYLVNLYGDVPLVVSTNADVNRLLPRSPKETIYQKIIEDLKDAQMLLSTNYLLGDLSGSTTERVRPTKWAATALLARVYLYLKDWANAESQATSVINQSALFDTVSLNNVFKANSKEAIWQLQPTGSGNNANTKEGRFFILPSTGPNGSSFPVYLSASLIGSFEASDLRKNSWTSTVTPVPPGNVTYYYAFKYKIGSVTTTVQEYSMVLRLAEQYLIRSEARAQQNKISESQMDLNVIRKRAGLANTAAGDKTSLLGAILQERRVELFTEWGHRWFDLIRTGNIDAVMSIASPQKGGTWNSNWALYPIPQIEIDRNPSLVGHQNPGY